MPYKNDNIIHFHINCIPKPESRQVGTGIGDEDKQLYKQMYTLLPKLQLGKVIYI